MGDMDYQMMWITNILCNFTCVYCSAKPDLFLKDCTETERGILRESPEIGKYSPQYIAKCFDDTGETWKIHLMGGGELFLYPSFIDLAETLTRNHYIALTTNLSTSNVYQFAEAISPERVVHIHASLHIVEREQRKDGISEFIKKVLHLQNKGFNISVHYVTYPPLFPRLLEDMDFFKAQGVDTYFTRPFQGVYAGRLYPESYTQEQKDIINLSTMDTREVDFMKVNALGRYCHTGQRFFHMDHLGNLARCLSSSKKYGNLFTGEYHFDESPRPCPVMVCRCPLLYDGYIEARKAQPFSILKEMLLEAYYRYPVRRPIVAAGRVRREITGKLPGVVKRRPVTKSTPDHECNE